VKIAMSIHAITYTANCLCGGIAYQLQGPLPPVQVCHCGQCRKAQGTVFATNAPVQAADVQWLQGQALLTRYESSPGKVRAFCSRCGSPVYSQLAARPEVLRLRLGLINEPIDTHVAAHGHVASKANWWHITDEAPQFEAGLPPQA
jgi:hypothetical protein